MKSIDESLKKANLQASDLKQLGSGYSSNAYSAEIDGLKVVILEKKPNAVDEGTFTHAHVVMNLLKKYDYTASPKPVALVDDGKILITELFEGVHTNEFDFVNSDVDQKETVMKILDYALECDLFSLEEYEAEMHSAGESAREVKTNKGNFKHYGEEWVNVIKQHCDDKNLVLWTEEKLTECKDRLTVLQDTEKPRFVHNDLSNPNILINKQGRLMLVDWDAGMFSRTGIEFIIVYLGALLDIAAPFKEEMIDYVSSKLNINREKLSVGVQQYSMNNYVYDVNWAAMMYSKAAVGLIQDDASYFKKLAFDRIKLYEDTFS